MLPGHLECTRLRKRGPSEIGFAKSNGEFCTIEQRSSMVEDGSIGKALQTGLERLESRCFVAMRVAQPRRNIQHLGQAGRRFSGSLFLGVA